MYGSIVEIISTWQHFTNGFVGSWLLSKLVLPQLLVFFFSLIRTVQNNHGFGSKYTISTKLPIKRHAMHNLKNFTLCIN